MKILRSAVLMTAVLVSMMFSPASFATHSWGSYHWPFASPPLVSSNPPLVMLELGDNLNGTWITHLSDANSDWNESEVLENFIVGGSTSSRRCKAQTGNVQVCNNTYGYNGWLGIAGIAVSGSHITAGYVKLNDNYFNLSQYNSDFWRQMVMCQEIGHTFGLDHQDEVFGNNNLGTCMDYTSVPDSNQKPNTHDYDQLVTIYTSHTDEVSGTDEGGDEGGCNPRSPKCNGASNGNGASAADILANIDMLGPAQWGRLVSNHGPVEVFELDFGHGRKVITFVTWALEDTDRHEH